MGRMFGLGVGVLILRGLACVKMGAILRYWRDLGLKKRRNKISYFCNI